MKNDEKFIILVGPTASGKSSLGKKLVEQKNYSVINLDSQQIVKGLPCLKAVPEDLFEHYLFQICDYIDVISVCKLIKEAIEIIQKKGRVPVLIGGSVFYIKALQEGLIQLPEISDSVKNFVEKLSLDDVKDMLSKKDPSVLEKFQDSMRLRRALCVFLETGESVLKYFADSKKKIIDQCFEIYGLMPEKDVLMKNIKNRIEQDFERFVHEVHFADKNYDKVIGFQEIKKFINGEIDQKLCKRYLIEKTWQYAKRQKTFIRNCLKIEKTFDSFEEIISYFDLF